jgi:hypothetical protein
VISHDRFWIEEQKSAVVTAIAARDPELPCAGSILSGQ